MKCPNCEGEVLKVKDNIYYCEECDLTFKVKGKEKQYTKDNTLKDIVNRLERIEKKLEEKEKPDEEEDDF